MMRKISSALAILLVLTTVAFGAASRGVPLLGDLGVILPDLNEELSQLYATSIVPLDTVAGTNDVTASVADMPVLTSYTNGLKVSITPVATNTGAMRLNIDGVGLVNWTDEGGGSFAGGEIVIGKRVILEYIQAANQFRTIARPPGGAAGSIVIDIQTFTASGTYTPTGGIEYAIVYCTGGGGGGGGADSTGASYSVSVGGGGAAGGTAINKFSAATLGASQAIVIGAGGTVGSNTGGTGGTGGTTTFGALLSATGGTGGTGGGTSALSVMDSAGGTGGVPTGGSINITGGDGDDGFAIGLDENNSDHLFGKGGAGGGSFWGTGGGANAESETTAGTGDTDLTSAGNAGKAFGTGGSGAIDLSAITGVTGGLGKDGVCMVQEFI